MKKTVLIAAALSLGMALSGCTAFRNAVGDPAANDALLAVKAAITAYADVYQPAVIVYGRLPSCGRPAAPVICRDDAVFVRLKAVDKTTSDAIDKARAVLEGNQADAGQLVAAVNAIATAEATIASSGALTAPAGK